MRSISKNQINATAIAVEWFIVISIVYVNVTLDSAYLIPVSVLIIGSRFHALGILMHEAAHFNLFSSTRWNDLVAQWFLCSPLFISLRSYRHSHILHHQHSLTLKDPTFTRKKDQPVFQFPKRSNTNLIWDLTRIFIGYGIILNTKDILRNRTQASSENRLKQVITLGFLPLFVFYVNGFRWFFILWIIPLFTVLPLLNFWRTVSEHSAVPTTEPTRTVVYGQFTKWLIAPYNVNYHLEHHIFPKKSWYNLPQVHLQSDHRLREGHVTHGIINLWREFVQ